MSVSKFKAFRNILYISLGKGLSLVCTAVTSFVLARNLAPTDYGVVGFATIVIGFLGQFSNMGIANAAIQRSQLRQSDVDTAFTLRVVLGCFALACAWLLAPFSHHFFDHPATANVIRLLALNFLIGALGFAPEILLTREVNFRTLMLPGVISTVVQSILVVALVLNGWSFWSVVIANIGGTLTTGIALQVAKKVPIRFRFDWSVAKGFLKFGVPLFGSGVFIFLLLNLDNFLVGSELGSVQLGYYALAFTWGSFASTVLEGTVIKVLFPTLSNVQNDTAAVGRWYLKTVELVAFIAVVINASLFANAHDFLVTFLGKGTDKWIPAYFALRILCIYGILRAITVPVGICIMVSGKTKVLLRANMLAGAIELLLLMLALRTGKIELVAASVLAAYSSQILVFRLFLREHYSIQLREIVARVWQVIPSLAIGWFATDYLLPQSFEGSYVTLVARGLFTASVVALTHGILTRFRCFHEARGMIMQGLVRAEG